jgi:peptide/nickel transport system permease protein
VGDPSLRFESTTTNYVAAPVLAEVLSPIRQRGKARSFVRRYPTTTVGVLLLGVMVFIAIFAPYLGTVDPTIVTIKKRTLEPSAVYWFGTDMLGRDLYSRVMYGARVSLTVGFSVAMVSTITGTFIGLISGFIRVFDNVVMRITDALMSVPPILLAIALMTLTQASIQNVVIAISLADLPRVARLTRGVVLFLREQLYVEAAITSGTRVPMIIWRHILPNTLGPLIVSATFSGAAAMVTESALSFIGAGTPPTIPSWGNIMAEARTLWQVKPYIIFIPAIFLSVTVLAVNLLGDGLRDALDPRLAKRL